MGIHGLLLVDHFASDFEDFEVLNIFQKVSWQLILMNQIVFPELYRPIIKLHREWLLDVQLFRFKFFSIASSTTTSLKKCGKKFETFFPTFLRGVVVDAPRKKFEPNLYLYHIDIDQYI